MRKNNDFKAVMVVIIIPYEIIINGTALRFIRKIRGMFKELAAGLR
jgi:hypothetical protein